MPSSAGAVAAASSAAARKRHEAQRKARQEHCVALDKGFVSASATLEQKRDYAACVQVLNPPPVEGGGGAFDAAWAILLVGLVALRFALRRTA